MNRRNFLQSAGMLLAGSMISKDLVAANAPIINNVSGAANGSADTDFPMYDLHVHLSRDQSIEDVVRKSREKGIEFGVMENIAPWGITDDTKLKAFIDSVKDYPVWIGLQPMTLGWSKNLSPDIIAQADYITMDPQVVNNANGYGEDITVWTYASYIDNPDSFMEVNFKYYMDILTGSEPLNVFACPFLLPISIEREYDRLWTEERQEKVIDALKARNIAIEINDLMRVPTEKFIVKAKNAGVKFTFGSDTRGAQTGRLDYCKAVATKCGLKRDDFFIPKRKLNL